jgi:hypothetical protein
MQNPPCSPDLAPNEFWLFSKMESALKGLRFQDTEDIQRSWIAQWYRAGLRAGWSGVWVPAEAGNFSLHHRVQTGSGAHPASYPLGTKDSFPGVKHPAREADHSPHLVSIRLREVVPPLPQYAFVVWRSAKKTSKKMWQRQWKLFPKTFPRVAASLW